MNRSLKRSLITILSAAALGGTISLLLGWVMRGTFIFSLLLFGLNVFVSFIVLLISILLVIQAGEACLTNRSQVPNLMLSIVTIALSLGAFIIGQQPGVQLAIALNYQNVQSGMQYFEALIPKLEAYKRKNGSYPKIIDDLLPKGQPFPSSLNEDFYTSDGYSFTFAVYDDSLSVKKEYYSPNKKWRSVSPQNNGDD